MTFDEFLDRRREAIREGWVARIVGDYPPESAKFIRSGRDRFRNPIGGAIQKGTKAVLDGLIDGADRETLKGALDGLIRLRAVQDFPPSMAVSFLFSLKEEFRREARGRGYEAEERQLEARIDELMLDAFDLYMECREKVFEIRLNEFKARTFRLLERAEEAQLRRGAKR